MIRDLDALKTFATIATLGSYARASDKLGISRTIASKRVSGLEAELGVKLINRTTRSMSLTEAGRKLHVMADTLFGLLESAEEDIRAGAAAPRGVLRINAPMSFGIRHLARIVDDFLVRYPEVEVEFMLDDRVVNIVEEGFDVAIRIRRLEDSSLLARYLAPAQMILCAAPAYLEKNGMPSTPADLERHECLVYDYLARQGVWSFERDGEHVDVRVRGRSVSFTVPAAFVDAATVARSSIVAFTTAARLSIDCIGSRCTAGSSCETGASPTRCVGLSGVTSSGWAASRFLSR